MGRNKKAIEEITYACVLCGENSVRQRLCNGCSMQSRRAIDSNLDPKIGPSKKIRARLLRIIEKDFTPFNTEQIKWLEKILNQLIIQNGNEKAENIIRNYYTYYAYYFDAESI